MVKIGDKVGFSATWLRSTFQLAGDIPHARGTVVTIDGMVAQVEWDRPNVPSRVLVKNLAQVGTLAHAGD